MKQLRKILSVVLAVLLLTAVGAMAVAAENDGSITIRDTVQGKNYDLYKVFDLTYDGDSVAYTIADGWQDFFAAGGAGAAYITDTDSGDLNAIVVNGRLRYINVTEDNVTDFAQAALAWAAEKPADRTAAGTGEDVTVTGLPLGYYLVYPRGASTHNEYSTGSICSLTSTTPAATVRIKAAWPAIDKKIAQDGGISENTASIGDSVPYVITGEVPDMTGFTKYYYIVTDTLSKGLTYNGDLAVAINGVTLAADTHYTVETDTTAQGETVLTIVFKDFIQWQQNAGEAITVTYSATVNQDAVIGTDPNLNTVVLAYSNDPAANPQPDPDNPDKPVPGAVIGQTPESQTQTYVAQIELTKVDGAHPDRTLTGARFRIDGTARHVVIVNNTLFCEAEDGTWYRLKDGTYTQTPPTDETAALYDSTTATYAQITVIDKTNADEQGMVAEGYVDGDGKLLFTGLGEGTYTITELVAPDGYNLLTTPVTVTLAFDKQAKTWSYTVAGNEAQVSTDGTIRFTVENNAGTTLPGTGGPGTVLLYVLGGLLVAGAVAALVTKRVRTSKNK